MLKMSSFLSDALTQSLPSLVDSSVNDAVIKVAPFQVLNQSFFQMIDIMDPATRDVRRA